MEGVALHHYSVSTGMIKGPSTTYEQTIFYRDEKSLLWIIGYKHSDYG